jgi:hypothetical protein
MVLTILASFHLARAKARDSQMDKEFGVGVYISPSISG